MKKPNIDLRRYAEDNEVSLTMVAAFMGWSESKLFRFLRRDLTEEERKDFMAAVDRAAEIGKVTNAE